MNTDVAVAGAGLGLRRTLLDPLSSWAGARPTFLEVAPENWMRVGGRLGRRFREFSERYPVACHGLSLSLGSTDPLDLDFLRELKAFLRSHRVRCYSEHLSYCSDRGHLYDLLPMPFTGAAVRHVAARIRQVQDLLECRIAIENVSYYAAPPGELSELEFLNAVLAEADCALLLDVNNVYVNAINHGYDAEEFLAGLPGARIAYGHIAGHLVEAEDLLVDTHGAAVVDPVWRLLQAAYRRFGAFPTLLERDFNIPPLATLMAEVERIARAQAAHAALSELA
ncbi:MAG: DUF692 domain-containing protein [Pseudomonadales bacterium]|nr:DUF692 domain-containing protein [Pseudomonadales bacterium]